MLTLFRGVFLRLPTTSSLPCRHVASGLKPSRYFSSDSSSASNVKDGPVLFLSDNCVSKLKTLRNDSTYSSSHLRVMVEGGGCSGFQYKFLMDAEVTPDDLIVEREGAKVLVDKESLELLRGATIDFQTELIREGFKVAKNPLAEKGCSCGVSFALRLD